MRTALFDVGGTLLETRGDPWRPLVLEAIRREFGARPWAETLYDADIRRPAPDDPHRQETNRWLSEWLKANAEELSEAEVEPTASRVRGAGRLRAVPVRRRDGRAPLVQVARHDGRIGHEHAVDR